MDKALYCYIILLILGCKTTGNQATQILPDKDWKDILIQSVLISGTDGQFIYNEFCNKEMSKMLSGLYEYCSQEFNYELKDSILDYINSRENSIITYNIDDIEGFRFIRDTVEQVENYYTFSEPFYISDEKLCLAFSYINKEKKTKNKWVCFFKKQKYYKLEIYYDLNKDMLFTPTDYQE